MNTNHSLTRYQSVNQEQNQKCEKQNCFRKPQKDYAFCYEHRQKRKIYRRQYQQKLRDELRDFRNAEINILKVRSESKQLRQQLIQEQQQKKELQFKLQTEIEQRSKSVNNDQNRDPDYLNWVILKMNDLLKRFDLQWQRRIDIQYTEYKKEKGLK